MLSRLLEHFPSKTNHRSNSIVNALPSLSENSTNPSSILVTLCSRKISIGFVLNEGRYLSSLNNESGGKRKLGEIKLIVIVPETGS
mgnify:CR=1 FL=1